MSYSWFRVEASIANHPKVLAFEALIGDPNGLAYVTRLHCWTHVYATSGTFSKLLESQVEAACKWRGEAGKLISAFVKVGLLDVTRRTLEVHDWEEFQGALVKKSKNDAELKRIKRAEERAAGAETARAGRAAGAVTLPTYETYETDGRSLEPPLSTPAVSAAVAAAAARVEKNWGVLAEQLAGWMRRQRALSANLEPDRESDIAAVSVWALAWCLKHEPDDVGFDRMYRAFNAYLEDDWAIERQCALALWCSENVGLDRWLAERAKDETAAESAEDFRKQLLRRNRPRVLEIVGGKP